MEGEGKTLVVITYLASGAQGRELEYAVAGWRRHFKDPYLIVLTGGNLPDLGGDDIAYVESPRIPEPEGQYWPHCDYVSCLMKVRERFPEHEGFILVADDCYAVNDFRLWDVRRLKVLPSKVNFDPESPNRWKRDKMKTRRALEREGLRGDANWTTHLPIWYEWDKVEALWRKYDMLHNSYVIEDLYHNTYCDPFAADVLTGRDRWKCGLYNDNPAADRLQRALERQIWITNSPIGFTPELVSVLEKHYFDHA